MHSKSLLLALLASGMLSVSCSKKEDLPPPVVSAPQINSLSASNFSPEPGTTVTSSTVLNARISYSVADNEVSADGFALLPVFEATNRSTLGYAPVPVPGRQGAVDISTPLNLLWNVPNLKHPLTCYYYLINLSARSESAVIARIGPFIYDDGQVSGTY